MNTEPASAFDNLGLPPLLVLLIPFFATVVGTPIARDLAIRFGIVDAPISGSSKIHSVPIPYFGGIPLFIAFAVGIYIILHETERVLHNTIDIYYVLASFILIFIVGLWDDLRGMIPGIKMFLLGAAGTILFAGGVKIGFIPDSWGIAGTVIAWALTLFWILGITNSANLMDNMNGLSSGTGIVAGLSLLAIGVVGSDPVTIGLSMILVGALLGYIFYNFPKAQIFFGDTGSMVLGFYLSFLGLVAGRLPAPDGIDSLSHILAPILVVGVFVFDTFFVAFSRGKRKINFWWGGKDHTSHRFVNYGFSKTFAVILVWLLGAVFGGAAILAKITPWWLSGFIATFMLFVGIWFWRKLDKIPVETVVIGASNVRRHQLSDSDSV
ncbi:MAG TPA: MraY family glycosyltransferase [bacterium]|jgi:UDP-GlcNAc:undecaprenyl-phosphate GlcNAc-1-phosphate transferase